MPEVKESDKWKTPGWFMAIMNQALIDRCPPNHIDDSLQTTWVEASYVNPPYSNPLPFVLKGLEEHKKNRIAVVFLLKLDPSTRWYKALVEGGGHFLFFAERLHYSEAQSAPFPSVLCILSD